MMKKFLNISLIAAICFYASACSNLKANAGKSLSTVATTVDASMHGWAAWVVTGKPSQAQQDEVKNAYQQYQVAMSLALNAYLALQAGGDTKSYEDAFAALVAKKDLIVNTTTTLKLKGTQ